MISSKFVVVSAGDAAGAAGSSRTAAATGSSSQLSSGTGAMTAETCVRAEIWRARASASGKGDILRDVLRDKDGVGGNEEEEEDKVLSLLASDSLPSVLLL